MTNKEWNDGIEYLENAKVGDHLEHNGRTVEVVNMIAGQFLCYNELNEFVCLVDESWKAMHFLRFGKLI